jgi:hypothetical protein
MEGASIFFSLSPIYGGEGWGPRRKAFEGEGPRAMFSPCEAGPRNLPPHRLLEAQEYRVIHFRNEELMGELEFVLEWIRQNH